MTFANTKAKNMGWIVKHFGLEGAKVVDALTPYGYGVTVWMTPEKEGPMFGVFKQDRMTLHKTRLGVFDTSEEAVNMMKLVFTSERNKNGNVD